MQTDYLEHYGRKGMKWYQHIFGEEDSRAAYKTNNKKRTRYRNDPIYGRTPYSREEIKQRQKTLLKSSLVITAASTAIVAATALAVSKIDSAPSNTVDDYIKIGRQVVRW